MAMPKVLHQEMWLKRINQELRQQLECRHNLYFQQYHEKQVRENFPHLLIESGVFPFHFPIDLIEYQKVFLMNQLGLYFLEINW